MPLELRVLGLLTSDRELKSDLRVLSIIAGVCLDANRVLQPKLPRKVSSGAVPLFHADDRERFAVR
jgi:hypothetical protein